MEIARKQSNLLQIMLKLKNKTKSIDKRLLKITEFQATYIVSKKQIIIYGILY